MPGNLIDVTPSGMSDEWLLTADFEDVDPVSGHCKGMEITAWISNRKKSKISYVIIDDENVVLNSQLPYFIQTDPLIGITQEQAERAIEILNR